MGFSPKVRIRVRFRVRIRVGFRVRIRVGFGVRIRVGFGVRMRVGFGVMVGILRLTLIHDSLTHLNLNVLCKDNFLQYFAIMLKQDNSLHFKVPISLFFIF